MQVLNALSRRWWRTVGRQIDLAGEHAWLAAPTSAGARVRDSWLQAEADRLGGHVVGEVPGSGLMPSMAALDGPGFEAARLHPLVRDFYEHTSNWRMEVWTGWSPVFLPGGALIEALYGRQSEQLALPVRSLATSRGMDSRVIVLGDADGQHRETGWLRTLRSTGEYVYSGCYSSRTLPGADRPSVHVAFPLEQGNVQVFLRPEINHDGSLLLRSPAGPFGTDGAYVVVRSGAATYAARPPLHETFHVYVDDDSVLRTDHELRLWNAQVVRLHYKLENV